MKIIISPAKTMSKVSLEGECGSLAEAVSQGQGGSLAEAFSQQQGGSLPRFLMEAGVLRDEINKLSPEQQQGGSLPRFLMEAGVLRDEINKLSLEEQQGLWKCNDELAGINHERFANMELEEDLSLAVFCYEGIQYKTMDPKSLDVEALEYLEGHLRILSGFYGVLRPFDGIVPYRLEMQAKLKGEGFKNVYDFWGSKLAQALEAELDSELESEVELESGAESQLKANSDLESEANEELEFELESELKANSDLKAKPESDLKVDSDSELESEAKAKPESEIELELDSDTDLNEVLKKQSIILNLASNEYSKAVAKHLRSETKLVTVNFGEIKEGKFKQKATLAKMARGAMVRFMAQNKVKSLEELKTFKELDLNYNEELSTEDNLFFTI